MNDPRTDRTKDFVLSFASRLLADEGADAVTFSRVSRESRVARSTLYRHWRSRDELICAASLPGFSTGDPGAGAVPQPVFVEGQRGTFSSPDGDCLRPRAEVSGSDPIAVQNFQSVVAAFQRVLEERLGPMDGWAHARIVGPIFFRALVMREPTDDATIGRWVQDVLAWSTGHTAGRRAG